jgi:hypothetical protein
MNNRKSLEKIFLKYPESTKQLIKELIVKNFDTSCYNFKTVKTVEDRVSSNPEFDNFFQSIYHAGTLEQFLKFSKMSENILAMNTFYYMFDVFKKGVFVQIKNNNIGVFLPFSKHNYVNDWGHNLKTKNGTYKDVVFIEERNHYNGYNVPYAYHTMVHKDPKYWYANNCFFRNTVYKNGKLRFKTDEGDKSISNFLFLLTELCFSRIVSDVIFFINPRDFPIVKKNMKHPYDRLYPKNKVPFLGNEYKLDTSLIPIFSQSITDDYSDTLIPNDDDILSILQTPVSYNKFEWNYKKRIAVFRGSATGCGVTPKNNQRLKLIEISIENQTLIDAKLTGLNRKLKVNEDGVAEMIDKSKYHHINKEYKQKYFMTSEQQTEYKYIIHVQGHVAAFRLTKELSYKSLILKVKSDYKTWYSEKLIGFNPLVDDVELSKYSHFINVSSDLSDLVEIVQWCINNDNICEKIAENSYNFWLKYLSNSNYMFNYMQRTLNKFSKKQEQIV